MKGRHARSVAVLLLAGLSACSSGSRSDDAARSANPSELPSATSSPAATTAPRASTAASATTGSTGTSGKSAGTSTSTPVPAGARPASCPAPAEPPPVAAGQGTPFSYTGTGTGSYRSPDGTSVSYAFPPRWTYVWRPSERLVELSASDALGTWGVAAASDDEALSRVSAVFLTAPDGRGGAVTFTLRLAAPVPLNALGAGASATGKAADESLVISVRRPGTAPTFEVGLRAGRCPATEGIGPGTLTLALDGASPPWSGIRFGFDLRLEDDQLKGSLQLRRG
jgi:hypothetical protein